MSSSDQVSAGFELEDNKLTVIIDTENLHLESVQEKDEDYYYKELYNDPEVMKSFASGRTQSAEAVHTMVKTWVERWKSNDPFSSLVITKQDSDNFVVQICLDYGNDKKVPGVAEPGYLLAGRHYGKGYASEAATVVTRKFVQLLVDKGYKVNNGKFTTIVATAHTDNPATIHRTM